MLTTHNIHSFIPDTYIVPLQETYSEAPSVQLRPNRNVLRSLQKEDTFFQGSKRNVRGSSFEVEGPITEKAGRCLSAKRVWGTNMHYYDTAQMNHSVLNSWTLGAFKSLFVSFSHITSLLCCFHPTLSLSIYYDSASPKPAWRRRAMLMIFVTTQCHWTATTTVSTLIYPAHL